jgi:hypothetical protein
VSAGLTGADCGPCNGRNIGDELLQLRRGDHD